MINALHKKDRVECGNYLSISLVAHAGKVFLKVVATKLSVYCKVKGFLPEEQCGFRSHHSTTDMNIRGVQTTRVGNEARVPLFLCFVDLKRAYDSVDSTLFRQVLARLGVPLQRNKVTYQSYHRMRSCVRSDDSVCSE